jgi:hypothetical protein
LQGQNKAHEQGCARLQHLEFATIGARKQLSFEFRIRVNLVTPARIQAAILLYVSCSPPITITCCPEPNGRIILRIIRPQAAATGEEKGALVSRSM